MSLYDGEKERKSIENRDKMKKLILMSIIIICLFIFIIIGLFMYLVSKPKSVSIILNNEKDKELLQLLKIEMDENSTILLDENGYPIIYAPIKDVAQYFGYNAYNGNYMTVSEDTDSCNVRNDKEVAIFMLDSNILCKKNLTEPTSNYETYKLSEEVFKEDDVLYTNLEGLKLAFNLSISYDSNTNTLSIDTLDYLISYYSVDEMIDPNTGETITKVQSMGYSKLDDVFVNQKAIIDNMLVVKNEQESFGVIDIEGNEIFGTQYQSLKYIPESKAFLVQQNGKFGITAVTGTDRLKPEAKVAPKYDNLQLIDGEKQLYLALSNKLYGVVDINGKVIIDTIYTQIGIENIERFSENNITNGYIIQDKLIPVQLEKKWGFCDLNGNVVGDGIIYESVGCVQENTSGTKHSVLLIPECNAVVVRKNNFYGCISTVSGEEIGSIGFRGEKVYMQILSGENKYFITRNVNGKEQIIDIVDSLN